MKYAGGAGVDRQRLAVDQVAGRCRRAAPSTCPATSSTISEPTCMSSGIASHWTNLRESPSTTSQQASAA